MQGEVPRAGCRLAGTGGSRRASPAGSGHPARSTLWGWPGMAGGDGAKGLTVADPK